ncbi:MAG: transposase [Wenzhouxiangellaceae bacterium]
MARPIRLEYEGALYHITARGNRREVIYQDNDDREYLLELLGQCCKRFNWLCYAYCLMDNHYHLLVETPDANLSKGMRHLNGVYTQAVNRRHHRVGHVFQGRFKAILVEADSYLLELSRYIVLNPVRAGIVYEAKDWPWSSYLGTLRRRSRPDWLAADTLLSHFGAKRASAIAAYRRFVSDGVDHESPWQSLKGQVFLGSDAFLKRMQNKMDDLEQALEHPKKQREIAVTSLADYEAEASGRDQAMKNAYSSGHYTLKAIAEYFNVHYSTVSRIVNRKL